MANQIITRIQVEGNDVVSFLNGATPPYQYVRGMSQIMPQIPTYISYRYDSITISQVAGEAFSFTVYTVTDVGGNAFTTLNFQDPADVVQAKTIEIYRLLVTAVFKGCCECGNTEPDCSIQYTAGNGTDAGTVLFDSGAMRVNYFTANNQDFTGFWPIIQDGSWIFVFSKTDPTVYGVFQLSGYTDGGPGVYAQFVATLLTGPGEFPEGTELCLDVTSVGGSLVQDWQATLDIGSILDKDNTVDGAGFNFVFDNNDSFTINSAGGSVEVDATGASLNAGLQQVLVTSSYIDVVTPLYGSATTGMVLALTASGHVEYTTAGTGTVVSVGLTMPSGFTVSNSPITISGDIGVVGAGTGLEYINGLGELATFPIYTAVSGLHTQESPIDPFVFHLGGVLLENALVTTTQGLNEWQLGVGGLAGQDTQFPFGVSNLGSGGVATFQDYGSGARTNPSVEIVGDADLIQPLLELRMEGVFSSLNDTYLRLKYEGTPSLASSSIDFQFRNNNVVPANSVFVSGRLTNTLTNFTDNNEQSKFELELINAGTLANKLEVLGTGQLILNEYGAATFINTVPTYGLVVDSSGQVWKKLVAGGGTVTSVGGAGLITTTATNPFTTSGTVTTSVNENRLVGRWDAAGTGIMQEITIGTNLDLTALGVLNASGGGFDVQVNSTTIIPPSTVLNLKNGTDITVVDEGSGNVRFDWAGTPSIQGLQDVIIEDNVLTQNNIIQGSITSFVWKSNSFYEINPTVNYDPGTGSVPGYFKAWIGKYPPSYSELYVEAIYAQMRSIGATTQIVKVDTIGVYVKTPGLGSATVGQVLTLQNATTGQVEYQDAGGGATYDSDQGVYKDTTLANDTFMLGAPLGSGSTIAFQEVREVDTNEDYLYIRGVNTSRGTNQEVLFVEHLAEGVAVYGQSLGDGIGVKGYSDLGSGVIGETDQGFGLYAYAAGTGGLGYALYGQSQAYGIYMTSFKENMFVLNVPLGLTNSVFTDLILSRRDLPLGGTNVGYGISLDFELVGASSYPTTSKIASVWATQPIFGNPTNAHLEFSTLGNSALEIVGRFKGDTIDNGQLQLIKYTTSTSFATASGASVGVLNVDNAGNVFVGTGGGSSPLTTKGDLYTFDTADTRLPVGLDTQVLLADSSTTTGLRWGTNTTPPALGYYGAFSDVTDQFATVINTGYPMLLGVTDLTNGVTVVSGSRVTIANTGIYNIQWSGQFRNPLAAEHDVTVWLRKNGVDVPGSAGVVSVPKKHGSLDGHTLPSWNFLLDVVGGDYYEFVWSTQDIAVFLSFEPAGSPPPSTASVVLTVTQQSGILAGTGITAINSLTGAVQTLTTGALGTAPAFNSAGTTHTLNIPQASTASVTAGLLSNTDYTTFNNKVATTRSISTTAPLSGGGDLSADRTLTIADAVADGATKGAASFTASDFNSASGIISLDYTNGQKASALQPGFLSASDFTTLKRDTFTIRTAIGPFSPADSTTYYFGEQALTNPTSIVYKGIAVYNCTLVGAAIYAAYSSGATATTETSTVNFRLNNLADTLLSNAVVFGGSSPPFANAYNVTGLSTVLVPGDTYVIKWTTPAWVTNPANAQLVVTLYFERT